MALVMQAAGLTAFLAQQFPQVADDFAIDAVTEAELVVRLKVAERHLRPGGTVSGPSMFALADVAAYLAILARIGPVALAVTPIAPWISCANPKRGVICWPAPAG